ncbi:fructosamine-3-kinase-like [Littorina saxatilis]|uniref:fructosamine-3-kinase-like n=1 Tax=Littorina saxatilis TaxID=31220 RepID=UPI0038B44710
MSQRMFDTEQQSLQLLASTGCVITVPASFKVFACADNPGAVHVLEYIKDLKPLTDHWAIFGKQMGRLHSYNAELLQRAKAGAQSVHQKGDTGQVEAVDKFGSTWEHYIGTFTPGKGWRNSWQELFIGDILQPLVSGVVEKYREQGLQEKWTWLQRHLHKVFDQVPITPVITHGDLCVANFGQTEKGPVLFDPSVQYAHSQFELILSHTEEKFDDKFFEEYHRIVPKGPLWDECMLVYELFYNIVMLYHVDDEKYKTGIHAKADQVKQMLQSHFGTV